MSGKTGRFVRPGPVLWQMLKNLFWGGNVYGSDLDCGGRQGDTPSYEDVLADSGYDPASAKDGLEALEILDHKHIDLIIMDVMIPNMDGYTLTKQLRDADYILPILMITAKVAQEDKKHGFRLGVDDYMTKPADEEEMLLRIAALLRRSKISAERKLAMGQTELLYDSMSVVHNGQSMELPQKEFLLLYKLFS